MNNQELNKINQLIKDMKREQSSMKILLTILNQMIDDLTRYVQSKT
jgi:hypothetical protein